jgi:phosphoribosylanthranilate isomerase
MPEPDKRAYPWIKVCGLTVPDEAADCAAAGADAIGVVFYPASKRCVTLEQARAVSDALPVRVPAIGVFVDPDREAVMTAITHGRLGGVQLHGRETPELIAWLRARYDGPIVKALYLTRSPALSEAETYAATAFLVECGRGALPGGNALSWDWGAARPFASTHPTVLAGGLAPRNVAAAIAACLPDGVDASSGLESAPGRKDIAQVREFIAQVRATALLYLAARRAPQPIFQKGE